MKTFCILERGERLDWTLKVYFGNGEFYWHHMMIFRDRQLFVTHNQTFTLS